MVLHIHFGNEKCEDCKPRQKRSCQPQDNFDKSFSQGE